MLGKDSIQDEFNNLAKETYNFGKLFEKDMKLEHIVINVVAPDLAKEVLYDKDKSSILSEFKKYSFHVGDYTKANPSKKTFVLTQRSLKKVKSPESKDKEMLNLYELVGMCFKEMMGPSKHSDYIEYNTISYFGSICRETYVRKRNNSRDDEFKIQDPAAQRYRDIKSGIKKTLELSDPIEGPKKLFEMYEDAKKKYASKGKEVSHILGTIDVEREINKFKKDAKLASRNWIVKSHFLGMCLALDDISKGKSLRGLFNRPKDEIRKRVLDDAILLKNLDEFSILNRIKNIDVNMAELSSDPESYEQVLNKYDEFVKELNKKATTKDRKNYLADLLNKKCDLKDKLKSMACESEQDISEIKKIWIEIKAIDKLLEANETYKI